MKKLTEWVVNSYPRFFTQMDRDSDSPTFGCFDRNFWHYKIRDFSSAILQQSCFGTWESSEIFKLSESVSEIWTKATIDFWSRLPHKNFGLNEYYPNESSYPATAFSAAAVTKILLENPNLRSDQVDSQINHTVRFLLNNFENEAINQQAAGLVALVQAKKLGYSVDSKRLEAIKNRFFGLQDSEGWFPEYGGPDLGYLSVTIDALVDYWEITNDARSIKAIEKAIGFMSEFIGPNGEVVGVSNSRETDYVVPYGLTSISTELPIAGWIVKSVFESNNWMNHFLKAIDDRYLSHYVFNSCVRAIGESKNMKFEKPKNKKVKWHSNSSILTKRNNRELLVVAANKGGSMVKVGGESAFTDYGYRVFYKNKVWTSNVLNQSMETKYKNDIVTITGHLVGANWVLPGVLQSIGLRIIAFIFGAKIIGWLKGRLIYKEPDDQFLYQRTILLDDNFVKTTIIGPDRFDVVRGTKHSIRHVASAFSYHQFDTYEAGFVKQTISNKFKLQENRSL